MSIYWCLRGGKEKASSRIQGWLIHESLVQLGLSSHVIYCDDKQKESSLSPHQWWQLFEQILSYDAQFGPQKGDVVVIQKLQQTPFASAIQILQKRGVVTLYVECDDRNEPQKFSCDAIIVPSVFLKNKLVKTHQGVLCEVVEDPVERFANDSSKSEGESYQITWVGSSGHWHTLGILQNILNEDEFSDLHLQTISDHPQATIVWDLKTVWKYWESSDVTVVPVGTLEPDLCKSNNRVTQAMGMNTAVICGDIPAYANLIDNYNNGIICQNEEDWRTAFRKLRSVSLRRKLATTGRLLAKQQYDISSATHRWIEIIGQLGGNLQSKNSTKEGWQIRSRIWREYIKRISSRRKKISATLGFLRELFGKSL